MMKKNTLEVEANPTTTTYRVVKRNGTIVPFRRERILYAITLAFRETKKIGGEQPLDPKIEEVIEKLTDRIVSHLLKLACKGTSLTVEGIQDFVEVSLMKQGYHDVARAYIIYRDGRKAKRENSAQNLKIFRQDKSTLVRFNPMKITSSIERSYRRVRQIEGVILEDGVKTINLLTQKVVERAVAASQKGEPLYIEKLQDWIEEELMNEKLYDVAKDFILYRSQKEAPPSLPPLSTEKKREFTVITKDGTQKILTEEQLHNRLAFACRGLENEVNLEELLETMVLNFYQGMKEEEIDLAGTLAARSKIEKDPAYSQVAARLLLDVIYRETLGISASDPTLKKTHARYVTKYLKEAISVERIHPQLLDFDLEMIANAIDLKRDDTFSYLGLQTLYDRYFIHHMQQRLETPQIFWMRVAMGLAIQEGEQKNKWAIEFYNTLSTFKFISATPTLFNSGTLHPQLSSCYLATVMDDLHHIFKTISDDAQLSKWAGGIGNDWTNIRSTGAIIKGTNGTSQGVIPFLKVANDTAVAVNQCFSADTLVYTSKGATPISTIKTNDLVLGISGNYRSVIESFAYNQVDPMVSIFIKHSISPITVTTGHPFYVIRQVPMKQTTERTKKWLQQGKAFPQWVEAGKLMHGDYIAQVIPQEIVPVNNFDEEDARLYGILLGNGCLIKDEDEWEVWGHSEKDSHLEFVCDYLQKKGVHFRKSARGNLYSQIHWAKGYGAIKEGTTDTIVGSGIPSLPFDYQDIYNETGEKQISPRLSHLPYLQTLALIQGLLETDRKVSGGKEIVFTNSSEHLIHSLRYQCLRLGIPTVGKRRVRKEKKPLKKRSEDPSAYCNRLTISYDLKIPSVQGLGEKLGVKTLSKKNWFVLGRHLFTRIQKVEKTPVTPFVYDLKVEGDESYMTTAALAHNGGKRKGAMCSYLETWHLDIEDFLELRKNTGDERRRTHDMNTANWIPDLFIKRVKENGMWTLFNPSDVKDLHDLYGSSFEKRYVFYEKMAADGKIKLFKKVEALQLWRKMLSMLFETGHPWITFKDPSNIRSSQSHVGVVHSSNLCTEILLNTSVEETAVCNLGSINLVEHMKNRKLDENALAATIRTAVRMLDNVIDINFYPILEAKNANIRHRPIGLGMMGFQDALYLQGISNASHEAISFADKSMEMISYYAILASSELAKERGTYSSYTKSKWDLGFLPLDTLDLLEKERGEKIDVDRSYTMNWNVVRDSIKRYGMRNSNTMAIAPTATISNIIGVTQSIEPMYKNLFVKSNLSGEFTMINPFLVEKLKELNLWDEEMIDDLKYFDGAISEIERIPQEIKNIFLTAFEIAPEWLIECAARRQKWIDMGQSLNLYLAEPSGKKLHQMYLLAWEKGLKTTYYLRTLAATQIEKSTMDINKRGLQPRWMKNKSASSNITVNREEKLKACNLEEGCESCQ